MKKSILVALVALMVTMANAGSGIDAYKCTDPRTGNTTIYKFHAPTAMWYAPIPHGRWKADDGTEGNWKRIAYNNQERLYDIFIYPEGAPMEFKNSWSSKITKYRNSGSHNYSQKFEGIPNLKFNCKVRVGSTWR